jgi:anti-sigma B factor antagonist
VTAPGELRKKESRGVLFSQLFANNSDRYVVTPSHHQEASVALKTSTIENGIGLIEVKGSLVGGDETIELRQAVAGFIDREYQKLIIDLSKVTYLNSTAIGVLVSAHTSYSRKGWQIKVCGVNKNINNIFVITKLTLVFDVREDLQDAIKSFT